MMNCQQTLILQLCTARFQKSYRTEILQLNFLPTLLRWLIKVLRIAL
jgi:hypothetical protein